MFYYSADVLFSVCRWVHSLRWLFFGVLGADFLVWLGLSVAAVLFSWMHCCARTFVVILLMV